MTMLMGIRRPDFNWEQTMKWWSAHSDGSHSPVSEEQKELQHWVNIDSCDHDDIPALFDIACFDVVQRVAYIGLVFNFDTKKDEELEELKILFESSKQFQTLFETSEEFRTLYEEEIQTLPETDDTEEDIAYSLRLLGELQDLAEYVDTTQELHSANLLAPFFDKVLCYKYEFGVYNKHAAVRTKAAEVVTTMVHNNPTNQQLVMEVNGLQPLLDNFISDPDVTARTKALVAISALIRKNKPGITEFRKENVGYAALRDALNSESVRFQWEALNLIQYLLNENSSDCNIVTQLGFPCIMMGLTSSDDAQVREAALRGLLVLARDEGDQLVRNDDKLKQVLRERIEGISAMPPEDLYAAREEIQLVDSLWNACYNEPSSLGEKGLLVLPGG